MRHRLLRTIFTALSLAFVAQLAVAWVCAFRFDSTERKHGRENVYIRSDATGDAHADHYWATRYRAFGAARLMTWSHPNWIPNDEFSYLIHRYEATPVAEPPWPARSDVPLEDRLPSDAIPNSVVEDHVVDLFGWPAHSMYVSFTAMQYEGPEMMQYKTHASRSFLRLAPPQNPTWPFETIERVRFLPVQFIVIGTVINTLLYALPVTLFFFAFIGIGTTVRNRRRSHATCPQCGYSLQHLSLPGCPECGWRR